MNHQNKRVKPLLLAILDYHTEIVYDLTLQEDVMKLCNLIDDLECEKRQLRHTLSQQEMEYATDCNRLAEENNRLKLEIQKLKNQK